MIYILYNYIIYIYTLYYTFHCISINCRISCWATWFDQPPWEPIVILRVSDGESKSLAKRVIPTFLYIPSDIGRNSWSLSPLFRNIRSAYTVHISWNANLLYLSIYLQFHLSMHLAYRLLSFFNRPEVLEDRLLRWQRCRHHMMPWAEVVKSMVGMIPWSSNAFVDQEWWSTNIRNSPWANCVKHLQTI